MIESDNQAQNQADKSPDEIADYNTNVPRFPFENLALLLQQLSSRYPWFVVGTWLVLSVGLFGGALVANENSFPVLSGNRISGGQLAGEVVSRLSATANSLIILALLVIILLTSFGTVVAALLGLTMAFINLLITISLVGLTRPPLTTSDIPAAIIVILVGLGISIDYTLFIVSRFRFKLRTSGSSQESLALANASAGKTNFTSALVWVVTLSGLLLVRDQPLTTIALGTLELIIIALLGSLTFLPASLTLLKGRINGGRLPYFGNDAGEGTGIWGRVVILSVRHPILSAGCSFGLLAALCFPLTQLHLSGQLIESRLSGIYGIFTAGDTYFLNLLLVWGYIVVLTFLIILILVRSVLLAAKAVLISLFSTGAALGIVVLVFEFGWFKELLGLSGDGNTIERNLPLLFFPLFFGFSISYQILTLQRVSEKRERGSSTRVAVANGPRVVSGVVVSAGAIMRTAITLMLAVQFNSIKQLGLGLVVGIYLDAVVVRCILGPAILQLLSRTSWHLPFRQPVTKEEKIGKVV